MHDLGHVRDREPTGRWHFLRKGKNFIADCCPVIGWLFAAIILSVTGWTLLLSSLAKQARAQEETALRESAILARAYADHLYQSLAAVDQITLYIKYAWEYSGGSFRLEGIEDSAAIPVQAGFFVAIFDRAGNLVTSVPSPLVKANAKDEPFFLAQKNSEQDHFYISEIRTGKFTNRMVAQFSRQLLDKEGVFDGVVLVSVTPDYFIAGYDQVTLDRNGFLGILGTDRSIRVTRVGSTVYKPEAPALASVPADIAGASGAAPVDGAPWFADRRNRFLAWQETRGYEMLALAGLDQQAAMAPYVAHRQSTLEHAAFATCGLFFFTAVAMFLSRRVVNNQKQLDGLRATYRMATEGGTEGFYIVRPLLDGGAQIADFEVVDCNRRGAELLSRRREELIGRRVDDLCAQQHRKLAMEPLREAFRSGVYETELEQPHDGPFRARWIHARIVRSEGNLAVTVRDISESKAHEIELEKRGNEDALTGLPNRHWVKDFLPDAIRRAAEQHSRLAVLFIDLDGFKAVNDTMGHDAGDDLLRHAGRRLKLAVRPHDHVGRIGGDEFVVIIENAGDRNAVEHLAERVLAAFQEKFRLPQGVHAVGTSIGISIFPEDGRDADTLLKHADVAMYSVKTSGKRNYRFFDEKFYEAVRVRHEREAELRQAIEQDQFLVYYQPRIDVASGTMSSMEALVRWAHPLRGIVEPAEFIPLAEETGMILPLGELVIDKVCEQLARWSKAGRKVLPVSVNVSARQVHEAHMPEVLARACERHRIEPRLVEVEVTESTMVGAAGAVWESLCAVQEMGIKLLVDDFGTGYSSLSKLQEMDFDVLKVDKAFTARLQKSREGAVLFTAIITMAHALGMRVVAEGVEGKEQLDMLKLLRCDEIQGYYIARPMPPAENQPEYRDWAAPVGA
ncbi:MAG TPA: EAL domain-containing protein [Noviherbaspirillum sp.]|uniref:bifunctional diguanylate cyclase/phosphodiesterase n=1 Tax=Noviherbaspirillum sp. TaxID=1926288 RepID=UPI002D721EE3|nr:EAL domain-containing protein [Noviherbaspirillum sp.]HYD94974.1 EAL domain-containing protein [Noviherbaspirillum sp.]